VADKVQFFLLHVNQQARWDWVRAARAIWAHWKFEELTNSRPISSRLGTNVLAAHRMGNFGEHSAIAQISDRAGLSAAGWTTATETGLLIPNENVGSGTREGITVHRGFPVCRPGTYFAAEPSERIDGRGIRLALECGFLRCFEGDAGGKAVAIRESHITGNKASRLPIGKLRFPDAFAPRWAYGACPRWDEWFRANRPLSFPSQFPGHSFRGFRPHATR